MTTLDAATDGGPQPVRDGTVNAGLTAAAVKLAWGSNVA